MKQQWTGIVVAVIITLAVLLWLKIDERDELEQIPQQPATVTIDEDPPFPEPAERSVGYQMLREPAKPSGEVVLFEVPRPEYMSDEELLERTYFNVPDVHRYRSMDTAALESLSYSDPAAALILARRTADNEKAKELVERTVALTWKTSPLIEWMTARDIGGMYHNNGKLDVNRAKIGYKIQFTARAISGYDDPMLEDYKRELRAAGVDTNAIERDAKNYFFELRNLRVALTGGPRP